MSLRRVFSLCALVGLCAFLLTPQPAVSAAEGPTLMSGGPLTFGPDDILFIADNAGAKIVALELGALVSGGTAGTDSTSTAGASCFLVTSAEGAVFSSTSGRGSLHRSGTCSSR